MVKSCQGDFARGRKLIFYILLIAILLIIILLSLFSILVLSLIEINVNWTLCCWHVSHPETCLIRLPLICCVHHFHSKLQYLCMSLNAGKIYISAAICAIVEAPDCHLVAKQIISAIYLGLFYSTEKVSIRTCLDDIWFHLNEVY